MKENILILLLVGLLGSCGVYPDPRPTKLSGIDQDLMMNDINNMVNSGEIDINDGPYLGDGDLGGMTGDPTHSLQRTRLPLQLYGNIKNAQGYQVATPSAGQPVRYSDSIQQVYIFPYQDDAGNYYDASIMYAVLEKSHWVGYPLTQVINETYDYLPEED